MQIGELTGKQKRNALIILLGVLGALVMYIVGLISQWRANSKAWSDAGGIGSNAKLEWPSFNIFDCYKAAFTGRGIGILFLFIVAAGIVFCIYKLYDKFSSGEDDERGFKISTKGTYGTAGWMKPKEVREVFEVNKVENVEGTILGEQKGNVVCMPENFTFNKHILILGASGTRKSRCIIRNTIFQSIKRGESAIITDPKGELYDDTSQLFRNHGYDVKVYNLVTPIHGDGWNCMSDLNGETLMASVLTNVIIGNTSSGKGDHFWDNAEMNLLKALILYVDLNEQLEPENKNLATVYQLLTQLGATGLEAQFNALPSSHPALAPYQLFAQSADNVKQGVILGLGTRLQILQDTEVKRIVSQSDIDLTAPGKKKCAYFIVTSDQDSTMAFLSSLFFSCLFIKLTRFADSQKGRKCPVSVNIILDEFNNIGKIGGSTDGSDFTRTLSTVRSRGMRVMIAVQSLGQLQNRYPNNLWSEIVGNCDIQLMLGCTDDITAEFISGRCGEITTQVESTRIAKRTVALMQLIPQYQETQGEGKRMLMTPDEVLRLSRDELLVIPSGRKVLRLNKFDYTNHPMSKELVPSSLMDYDPSGAFRNEDDDDSGLKQENYEDAYMALMSSGSDSDHDETEEGESEKDAHTPKMSTEEVFAARYGKAYEKSRVPAIEPDDLPDDFTPTLPDEIPGYGEWNDVGGNGEASQSDNDEEDDSADENPLFRSEEYPRTDEMENVDSFVLEGGGDSGGSFLLDEDKDGDTTSSEEPQETIRVDEETGEVLDDDPIAQSIFNTPGKSMSQYRQKKPSGGYSGSGAKKVDPKDLL